MTRANRTLFVGAALLALTAGLAAAQEQADAEPSSRPVYVSEPVVPTTTPAVRDLPDWKPDPNLFGLEMKRREDFGFVPIEYPIKPRVDPLLELQQLAVPLQAGSFSTLTHSYAGQSSNVSPPDTTGDVGLDHFVQAVNLGVSTVRVLDKSTGANLKTFQMQSLTTASPCKFGFCDPVVLYDRAADRWIISELPSLGPNVCVYVSTTGDPTGTWYAYTFALEPSGVVTDFPKYGVWPQGGNGGSYLMGANAGSGSVHDLFALDRAKMLAGLPATFQKFSVPNLPNSGFQLVLPSTLQGNTPPPDGEPAIFMRPHDDEAENGASTPGFDLMDMWTLRVDWATPANSTLTQLTPLHIGDYDMTLCGMGNNWNCMPQPGTAQKLDPIREPLHFPLQYRNFGSRQTLVGTFPEDVDGTDHAALRWFEIRKTGAGAWTLFQEGLVGGEAGVHRSVGSAGMDGSGNIAIGYTRTGANAPYYPSIYYKGRLAADTLGTMPQGEYPILDGTFSKTGNERWGDYAGLAVDPVDDCTFWFTTEYMTSNTSAGTRVAAFKFDGCGCAAIPAAPIASASAPQYERIDVSWNDSATPAITQYLVFRSTTAGGPYTQLATVADSSPGAGDGAPYTYHDDTVSGGTRYYYVVRSMDGGACVSADSAEVNALATQCLLAPAFGGLAAVANAGIGTCTLNLSWAAGTSSCSAGVTYTVYRGTAPGFTPAPANRIAVGVLTTAYGDAVGLASGTTYYYVVRAVDDGNGIEDANTTQKNGAPTGAPTTSTLTDTFEGALSGGGFDHAGWTHNALTGATNWAWSTAQNHDGTHSWFAANVGSVSDKVLVSPAFDVGPATTLSFWHTFRFGSNGNNCRDGGTLEYTTSGGSSWTVVPAGDFTAGGYTGTVSTGSANPIEGKPAWCKGTVAALTVVTVNLGADANLVNKTAQIRWHEGDDNSGASTGWYVDTVTLGNIATVAACTTGGGCTAPGAPSLTGAVGDCAGVHLTWTAGTGSTTSYNVSRATQPGGPYTKLGGMPVAGTAYTDATAVAGTTYYYVVTGACDVGGATESPASNELSASKKANGTACDDGNVCTQTDTCQSGACFGGNPVVCTALDPCHVAGSCNTGTGVCSNPVKPDGSVCSDANPCTQTDACQSGLCIGSNPIVCATPDQCHVTGTCNTGTGVCSNPAKANGSACNDGNACTQTDTCQSGACLGGNPVVCEDLDACHAAGVCSAGTGVCSNPAKADGSTCSDGDPCTAGEGCLAGVCSGGTPVPAPAGTSGLAFDNESDLNWASVAGADGYDVIRGTLSALRGSGSFGPAVDVCLGDDIPTAFVSDGHLPAEGDADWFLVRATSACGIGTFDEGAPSQAGSREAGIAASPNACP